jgi:hypothetical protein
MNTALQRKEEVRLRLLQHFYRVTDGISARLVAVDVELAGKLDATPSEMDSAVEFLAGEGLLKQTSPGGGYGITHEGVVEAEESLREPACGTEHFEPATINAVNNATPAGRDPIGDGTAAAHPVIVELREKATSLPPEKRDEAHSVIDEIEDMLEKGPKALVATNKLIESLVTYWPEAMPWLASLAQQAGRFLAG